MRLYLSSYLLGKGADKLPALLGDNKQVAVVGNAVDFRSSAERVEKVTAEINMLEELGLSCEELDLRDYFGKKTELLTMLKKYGLVWIRGGNVFVLQRAMQASGFDELLKDLLKHDQIVYAGYSAAACVLAPTLKGYTIVDDPKIVPAGYNPETPWKGLAILDYSIEPHYKSDHPESADVDKEVEYLEQHGLPYRTLRDGEVLIINGDKEELIK